MLINQQKWNLHGALTGKWLLNIVRIYRFAAIVSLEILSYGQWWIVHHQIYFSKITWKTTKSTNSPLSPQSMQSFLPCTPLTFKKQFFNRPYTIWFCGIPVHILWINCSNFSYDWATKRSYIFVLNFIETYIPRFNTSLPSDFHFCSP